jgi:hypothetical protein
VETLALAAELLGLNSGATGEYEWQKPAFKFQEVTAHLLEQEK